MQSRRTQTYEHIDPSLVEHQKNTCFELAGKTELLTRAKDFNLD